MKGSPEDAAKFLSQTLPGEGKHGLVEIEVGRYMIPASMLITTRTHARRRSDQMPSFRFLESDWDADDTIRVTIPEIFPELDDIKVGSKVIWKLANGLPPAYLDPSARDTSLLDREQPSEPCCCKSSGVIHATLKRVDDGPPILVSWQPYVLWWTPNSKWYVWPPGFVCKKLRGPLFNWLCVAKRARIPRDVALLVCEWAVNTSTCKYNHVAPHILETDIALPSDTPPVAFLSRPAQFHYSKRGFFRLPARGADDWALPLDPRADQRQLDGDVPPI